jgi:hypothetical protein
VENGFITENMKITKVKDPSTANTGDVTSDIVDMAGFDGCIFVTSYGTAAADNLMHVESGDASNMSDAADLAGGEIDLGGASDEDQALDVLRPQERYLRVVAQRGTSTALGDIWAFQYKAKDGMPISNLLVGTICCKRIGPFAAEGTK